MKSIISILIIVSFIATSVIAPQQGYAQEQLNLPAPGAMVSLSHAYAPVLIKGLKVHPDNPFLFDFILDTGNSGFKVNSPAFKSESEKLIKYFLASLTIKEDDLWVNLSPYEKDRIVPDALGKTELGRDMLAQDYILKQLTASLIYPEKRLGQEFWDRIYAQAQQKYGTISVPVNTFNKVWIVADKAKILERNNVGYVVGSHLKVMLEEDYMALEKHTAIDQISNNKTHTVASQLVREIILPALEKEVNIGKNFAPLRQMFYSMILASWYKLSLKNALLNQVYTNKGKTGGVLSDDPAGKERIYEQYLKAYKKGVFNYIKEDVLYGPDSKKRGILPRKYFSGGVSGKVVYGLEHKVTPGDDLGANGAMAVVEAEVGKVKVGAQDKLKGVMSLDAKRRWKMATIALVALAVGGGVSLSDADLGFLSKHFSFATDIHSQLTKGIIWTIGLSVAGVIGMIMSVLSPASTTKEDEESVMDGHVPEFDLGERFIPSIVALVVIIFGLNWGVDRISESNWATNRDLPYIEEKVQSMTPLSGDDIRLIRFYNTERRYEEESGNDSLKKWNEYVRWLKLNDAWKKYEPLVKFDSMTDLEKEDLYMSLVRKFHPSQLFGGQSSSEIVFQRMWKVLRSNASKAERQKALEHLLWRFQPDELRARLSPKDRLLFEQDLKMMSEPTAKSLAQATNAMNTALINRVDNPGGIDLNPKNMSMNLAKDGQGIVMHFDPALVAQFQRGDFTGIVAQIIRITPIKSALALLGS